MTSQSIDPIFAAGLREQLIAIVQQEPRRPRRRSWRLGAGVTVGVLIAAGGAAFASGAFNPPGAPSTTPLGSTVTATRTGTATIDLGPRPAGANDVSLTFTCLSAGTFRFLGDRVICSSDDLSEAPIYRQASTTFPLPPGLRSISVTTSPGASWTLQADYVSQTVTAWGINSHGQTYGVMDSHGIPDLIAVGIPRNGVQGYVKASDNRCATGGDVSNPAQAIAWDKASANRNISIPVYMNDGTTVIGTFIVGDAKGPAVQTVPLSESHLVCDSPGTGVTLPSNGS